MSRLNLHVLIVTLLTLQNICVLGVRIQLAFSFSVSFFFFFLNEKCMHILVKTACWCGVNVAACAVCNARQ